MVGPQNKAYRAYRNIYVILMLFAYILLHKFYSSVHSYLIRDILKGF